MDQCALRNRHPAGGGMVRTASGNREGHQDDSIQNGSHGGTPISGVYAERNFFRLSKSLNRIVTHPSTHPGIASGGMAVTM